MAGVIQCKVKDGKSGGSVQLLNLTDFIHFKKILKVKPKPIFLVSVHPHNVNQAKYKDF